MLFYEKEMINSNANGNAEEPLPSEESSNLSVDDEQSAEFPKPTIAAAATHGSVAGYDYESDTD